MPADPKQTAALSDPTADGKFIEDDDDDYDEPFTCNGQPSPGGSNGSGQRPNPSSNGKPSSAVGLTFSAPGSYDLCLGPSNPALLQGTGVSMTLPRKPATVSWEKKETGLLAEPSKCPGSYQPLNARTVESHLYTRATSTNGINSTSMPVLSQARDASVDGHGGRAVDRCPQGMSEHELLYSKSTGVRPPPVDSLSRKTTLFLFALSIAIACFSLLLSFLFLTGTVEIGQSRNDAHSEDDSSSRLSISNPHRSFSSQASIKQNCTIYEALPGTLAYHHVRVCTGPRGPTGRPGRPGQKGLKGDTGRRGDQGQAGIKGDTGRSGSRGHIGSPGMVGRPGPQGFRGPQGYPGPKGEPGKTGPKGEIGAMGLKGEVGAPGPKGSPFHI